MFQVSQQVIVDIDDIKGLGSIKSLLTGDNYLVKMVDGGVEVVVSNLHMTLASRQDIIEDRSKRFLDGATA